MTLSTSSIYPVIYSIRNKVSKLRTSLRVTREKKGRIPLGDLLKRVSETLKVDRGDLCSGDRRSLVSKARSVISYVAVSELGYSGVDVAQFLAGTCPAGPIQPGHNMKDSTLPGSHALLWAESFNLSGAGVAKSIEKGKRIILGDEVLKGKLIS